MAKAMMEASKIWSINRPRIGKPSDTYEEKRIKKIFFHMLKFKPSSRITAEQVLLRLIQLKDTVE